jgi:hypothetical protein
MRYGGMDIRLSTTTTITSIKTGAISVFESADVVSQQREV